jgi:hypothetical protein
MRDSARLRAVGQGHRHRRALEYIGKMLVAQGDHLRRVGLPVDRLEQPLKLLAQRHDVVAVTVDDPSEQQLPDIGLARFVDPETARRSTSTRAIARVRAQFAETVRRSWRVGVICCGGWRSTRVPFAPTAAWWIRSSVLPAARDALRRQMRAHLVIPRASARARAGSRCGTVAGYSQRQPALAALCGCWLVHSRSVPSVARARVRFRAGGITFERDSVTVGDVVRLTVRSRARWCDDQLSCSRRIRSARASARAADGARRRDTHRRPTASRPIARRVGHRPQPIKLGDVLVQTDDGERRVALRCHRSSSKRVARRHTLRVPKPARPLLESPRRSVVVVARRALARS